MLALARVPVNRPAACQSAYDDGEQVSVSLLRLTCPLGGSLRF
jgi:hypothetical protein